MKIGRISNFQIYAAAKSLDGREEAETPPISPSDQLISEGCWEVPNGSIQCPIWHPASQPYPVYQETADGFVVGMHYPGVIDGSSGKRYHFRRQADGSFIYRSGGNWIIIHADGSMEDNSNSGCGILPFQNSCIPYYIWREVEEATRVVRRQMVERYDISVTREALDNLYQELSEIIRTHNNWSLAEQHDFLFRRWDECREDTVGNEARPIIVEFIRQHFPQGSAREITEKELSSFNERRVTESQSFNPYPD